MKLLRTINELRQALSRARSAGAGVALVPTMGALHEGHMSLIDAARASLRARGEDGVLVVSVFVNPTQFGPGEDLANYPRKLQADRKLCNARGVDILWAPSVEEMYPAGKSLTSVSVAQLSGMLCGRTRPGHFDGVCTVVAKLLNIVKPDEAYFGEKDYQQVAVLRQMTADLNFPVKMRTCPTIREQDGLAMSSRNAYLSPEHRSQAPALYGALRLAKSMIAQSHPPTNEVVRAMTEYLADQAPAGDVEYIQIVDPLSMKEQARTDSPVRILLAVRFDGARLIDNMAGE
jgi:pantoate--beta-alanine ligase